MQEKVFERSIELIDSACAVVAPITGQTKQFWKSGTLVIGFIITA
jgi:hypothetical protein